MGVGVDGEGSLGRKKNATRSLIFCCCCGHDGYWEHESIALVAQTLFCCCRRLRRALVPPMCAFSLPRSQPTPPSSSWLLTLTPFSPFFFFSTLLSLRRFLLLFLRAQLRGAEQFVLFFPLHPTVLEPDFDLPFRQTKRMGDLDPSAPGQVAIEVKFLLQL